MTLAEFVTRYGGGSWDFDGRYGPQCADLVNFYNRDVLGAPQFPGASAKDFYGELTEWFDWIPNLPDNFPQAGDVVVWDASFGNGNGHTSVALQNATKQLFPSLDQNWGPVVTHTVLHTYQGVIGWGRPKRGSMTTRRALVRLAYMAGLGREPESVKAIDGWANSPDDDETMVQKILDSTEGVAYRKRVQNQVSSLHGATFTSTGTID